VSFVGKINSLIEFSGNKKSARKKSKFSKSQIARYNNIQDWNFTILEKNFMEATTKTQENPLLKLAEYGQSPWLDYIRRDLFTTGELQRLIDEDGLKGMTSNPAIFEKAIGSEYYKDSIAKLAQEKDLDAMAIYEKVAIEDIQQAADALRGVYDATKTRDGYVSLEVSPALADDAQGTLEEARRLWKAVDRPNLMVKVPATAVGFDTIRQLISEGININVTLLFSQESYRKVAEAFVAGLEKRAEEGQELSNVASVASFFVSRIDSLIDSQIDEKLKTADGDDKKLLESVRGKVAIANAKLAYQAYEEIFSGERWEKLEAKGAQTQRVLWASTGTKNKDYSDVLYIEELIGKDTVNTIPPATWDAFRDHGKLRNSLTEDVAGAKKTLEDLEKSGISLKDATDKLLVDAVRLFVEPFDKMIAAVETAINENKK
jgi:transaldolase / glucose-6-phosphate isomerase